MCTLNLIQFTLKMKKNLLIWTIKVLVIVMTLSFFPTFTSAVNDLDVNGFEIMPKLDSTGINDVNEQIYKIWYMWWQVWENYNDAASKIDTSEQLASWIMNRDTILNYMVFIVEFLSQLWLLVWAWFIMYAWYKYMLSVFNWWKAASSTLKNAIIWIIIVIFSFAIMRILTSIIWLT